MTWGSGRYLADPMVGAMPHINSEGLDVSRYPKRSVHTRDPWQPFAGVACH
jgi:hypothetical protein